VRSIRPFLYASLLLVANHAVSPAQNAATRGAVSWPTHGWPSSTPEAQGMDARALARLFDVVRARRIPIHSLLIVRNGAIVLDASFFPYRSGDPHDLASVTKSVTSTLIGIAIGEHLLHGVDQTVLPLFPRRRVANRDARKERLTLEHLLTMTSGLDCRFRPGEITLGQMQQSPDWIQFMLDLPMDADPGSRFEYCSGGMHLLSGIVSLATGMSPLEYARRRLFEPLGIDLVIWPADPQGISHGWGDLNLAPRDAAKIGYLWLHDGRWEDRQIIPAQWLRAATRPHSHPDIGSGEYGYGFWVYPDRDPLVYEALGRGGQRVSVVPAKQLVVVFTGGGFEPGDIGDIIGEALKADGPIAPDPTGDSLLMAAVAAAAQPPAAGSVAPAPALAAAVSGREFVLDTNPLGLRSLSLTFPGGSEARLRLRFSDGRDEERPVGLDGVPRLSLGGRYGLLVAVAGTWTDERTFAVDYDEVANVNDFRLRVSFSGPDVGLDVSERTGLIEAHVRGRARGN
jgi:CubicO group peptidase (beta-lactamase class C family)